MIFDKSTLNFKKDAVQMLISKPNDIDFLYAITAGLRFFDEMMKQSTSEAAKDVLRAEIWEYKRWLWSVLENIVPVYTRKLNVYIDQVTTDTDLDYFLKLLQGFGVKVAKTDLKRKCDVSPYEDYVISKNYNGWS